TAKTVSVPAAARVPVPAGTGTPSYAMKSCRRQSPCGGSLMSGAAASRAAARRR
ncbi:transposase for IS1663, partial [Bordetella bronchiseptica MO211]